MKIVGKAAWFLIMIWLLVNFALPTQPARAAGFHISGRNLLDANGNNSIMRGISRAHVWYPNPTVSFANIKAAGANTVRVVLGEGRWGPSSASDVANTIQSVLPDQEAYVIINISNEPHGNNAVARTTDYSFSPTKLSFTDWDHVALYRNSVRVWGTEP